MPKPSHYRYRKASFKQPPRHVLDTTLSQAARRKRALEEQKRRRAKRVESERHIDLFADLNLGNSDDEVRNGDEPDIVRDGVAQLAPLLTPSEPSILSPEAHTESNVPTTFKRRGKRKKAAATTRVSNKNTSAWADKCMYAELLEMQESDLWPGGEDGLPSDLESGWVALAPVPVGKRCLAISHQGGGMIGVVPNTTIRSRVLGKPLMARFPSPLPSDTVLDCILDHNWRENGILHVLDVIKWKGQDIADCESSFRFWWRDTRLSELPPSCPPTTSAPPPIPTTQASAQTSDPPGGFRFPYPTTFLLVPCFTDTTFAHLLGTVIPRARSSYRTQVFVPSGSADADVMDVESPQSPGHAPRASQAEIQADGLLLYVAQAIYEPGTSPLSSWVPLASPAADGASAETSSPLDVFERLVKRRVARGSRLTGVDMLY